MNSPRSAPASLAYARVDEAVGAAEHAASSPRALTHAERSRAMRHALLLRVRLAETPDDNDDGMREIVADANAHISRIGAAGRTVLSADLTTVLAAMDAIVAQLPRDHFAHARAAAVHVVAGVASLAQAIAPRPRAARAIETARAAAANITLADPRIDERLERARHNACAED